MINKFMRNRFIKRLKMIETLHADDGLKRILELCSKYNIDYEFGPKCDHFDFINVYFSDAESKIPNHVHIAHVVGM